MYAIAAVFLLLSGASGLIYEISWARLFSVYLGSDNISISVVISCFFLGMAIGAYLSAYLRQSNKFLINTYIILELIIGLYALLLLPTLSNLGGFIESYPELANTLLSKSSLAFVLLILPTICLGATYPIITRLLIRKQQEVGLRIGQLYFFNTFGAVLGCLAAGVLLIPEFGLDGAIIFAACLNIGIVIIAIWFRTRFAFNSDTEADESSILALRSVPQADCPKQLALLALAVSGLVLLACEVAWSKYFSILTGSSLTSFSMILASTLTGIALGAWYIGRRISTIKNPANYLTVGFTITAILLLLLRWVLGYLPDVMQEINSLNFSLESKQSLRYILLVFLLIPVTFMFGVLFPLALNLYINKLSHIKTRMAHAYALNTFFGIIGALIAGFWLVPVFGTDVLLKVVVLILLIVPLFALFLKQNNSNRPVLVSILLLTVGLTVSSSGLDYQRLISNVDYRYKYIPAPNIKPEYLYLKEGQNSVVSLVKYDDKYARLQSNGLQESMIPLSTNSRSLVFETLQAYMPYFMHSNPKSTFSVGYGGGITTQAFVDTSVEKIEIVEIEGNIVEAVKSVSNGPAQALKDDRVSLSIGDARTALLINPSKYDIITSQPSHPWVAGSGILFTKEFFQLVKSRLNTDGIFSQWIALFGMDTTTLKAILKSFYDVFPYGFTMENRESGDMMLIGSKKPLLFDYQQMKQRMSLPTIQRKLNQLLIQNPKDLMWFFMLSRDEVIQSTKNSELNTDLNLLSETRLSFIYANGVGKQDPYNYLRTTAQFDVLPYLDGFEAKYHLFEIGQKFLEWNKPEKALQVAKQMSKLDTVWGKSLFHEVLYWQFDFNQATKLYESQSDWMDTTHYRQFQISVKEKKWAKAEEIIVRILSQPLKQLSQTIFYYEKKEWEKLATRQAQTMLEFGWQLAARLKQKDFSVLPQLASMTEIKYENLPLLQVIADAYRNNQLFDKTIDIFNKINIVLNAQLNFFATRLQSAKLNNNLEWQLVLESEIQKLTEYLNVILSYKECGNFMANCKNQG